MIRHSVLICLAMLFTTSCMTTSKEKQIHQDIYNLQTRLLRLEGTATPASQTEQNKATTNQNMAQVKAQLDKIQLDLQKLKGEVDTLRVGIRTGHLPGSDPNEEGSLTRTLNDMISRLETVETNQTEILTAIDQAGVKAENNKKKSMSSLAEFRQAFKRKRYSTISDDAPVFLAKLKKKTNREEIIYLHAESLYKLGKIRDAALKFSEFLETKPSVKYLPHAKMRIGDCFRHLGDAKTAKMYYNELVSEFGTTPEAEQAKERLKEIGEKGA